MSLSPIRSLVAVALLLFALSDLTAAQAVQPLTTQYASTTGEAGCYFDVVATNDVSIHGIDTNLTLGTHDVAVYVLPGAGWQSASGAASWVQVGSLQGVASGGRDQATRVGPLQTCVDIPAGTTTGFYVTVTNGSAQRYSIGTAVGNVAASDANLTVLEGAGVQFPFGGTFQPRVWIGSLYYAPLSSGGACLPLPRTVTPYQINRLGYSASILGVASNGQSAAATTSVLGGPLAVDLVGPSGTPFEAALDPGGVLLPSGFVTSGNSVVNLDLGRSLVWLNGGAAGAFAPFMGSGALPLSFPAPVRFAVQGVFVDPSQADGIQMTQGLEHEVTALPPTPGPASFNQSLVYPLASPITYYGITFSEILVSTNGRVFLGRTGALDATASVADALSDDPFLGCWTFLGPGTAAGAGLITIRQPAAGVVRVVFDRVPYAITQDFNSFASELDSNTNTFMLDGLAGIVDNSTAGLTDTSFLGFSMGNLGATDSGPTPFTLGSAGTPAAATDMLYDFWDGSRAGRPVSLSSGTNTIQLAFSGALPAWVAF